MKLDAQKYLNQAEGAPIWRARLGHGSFLTFDFGAKVKSGNHWFGNWHLWIYMCEWQLFKKDRQLLSSDDARSIIDVGIRRLEGVALKDVKINEDLQSSFTFSEGWKLRCKFYDDADADDEQWIFYGPSETVSLRADGTRVEPRSVSRSKPQRRIRIEA